MYRLILLSFILLSYGSLAAQDMGYGFKAGLNFSTFQGPSEQDAAGMDLENSRLITGFHIAAIINFKFTDLFGVRTEIGFSQKGNRMTFAGDSYQRFISTGDVEVNTVGLKNISLNVTNAYIDVPVLAYVRATNWLEVSAGINAGFLVNSTGAGELEYTFNESNTSLEQVIIELEHNYRDDIGGGARTDETTAGIIKGFPTEIPRSLGAYYDFPLGSENRLYNIVDFGLNAGVNLYLNQGLSLGLRANYGLADVTNNEVDANKSMLDADNQLIFVDDKDTNLSFQVSIGFSF